MEHITDIFDDIVSIIIGLGVGTMTLGVGLMLLAEGYDDFMSAKRRNEK